MSTTDSEHRYPVILVLLDGTEMQEKVLERAIDIAGRNSAKLIIGHAVDSTILETAGAYPVDLIPGLEKAFKGFHRFMSGDCGFSRMRHAAARGVTSSEPASGLSIR